MAAVNGAQNEPTNISTSVTQNALIFGVVIEDVKASSWDTGTPQKRTVSVRARVTRIVKDDFLQDLQPSQFMVSVTQARWPGGFIGDNPYFWSYRDLEAGQSYLIFSNIKQGFGAMFASPAIAERIAGEVDLVADVELIVSSVSRSAAQQAEAAANALRSVPRARSRFFAEYALALLVAGRVDETAALADAVENGDVSMLLEETKSSLLWGLFQQVRRVDSSHARLVQLFVSLNCRSLSEALGHAELAPLQAAILENYVPWILDSPQAVMSLRTLPMSVKQALIRTTSQLITNGGVSKEGRDRARQLQDQISER